jgi:hypothetical protein
VRGTSGALKRELGAWAGVMAEKPDDVHECPRAGPWRRESKGDAWGQRLGAGEPGPRDRERRRARGRRKTGTDRLGPLGS